MSNNYLFLSQKNISSYLSANRARLPFTLQNVKKIIKVSELHFAITDIPKSTKLLNRWIRIEV